MRRYVNIRCASLGTTWVTALCQRGDEVVKVLASALADAGACSPADGVSVVIRATSSPD